MYNYFFFFLIIVKLIMFYVFFTLQYDGRNFITETKMKTGNSVKT